MKKTITLTILILLMKLIHGQDFIAFGAGYNASFVNPKTVNTILRRYNETRTGITEPFGQIRFLDGGTWGSQIIIYPVIIDFNFAKRVTVVSAQGEYGTGIVQRDIKFKASTFNMGLGLNFTEDFLLLGFGFDFDLGANRIDTRINYVEYIKKTDYETIMAPLMLGGSIWGQAILCTEGDTGIGIIFRPYYHFDFLPHNYQWVNEEINPDTYEYDTFDPYGKLNHLGFLITAVITIRP